MARADWGHLASHEGDSLHSAALEIIPFVGRALAEVPAVSFVTRQGQS